MQFQLRKFILGMDMYMGKNKSTKQDGVKDFADTQDLDDKRRLPLGAGKQRIVAPKEK